MLTSNSNLPAVERRALISELEAFRQHRLEDLQSGRLYDGISRPVAFLLHVLPVGGLNDMVSLGEATEVLRSVELIEGGGWDKRFNADGLFVYSKRHDESITGYIQWFRCGGLEMFGGDLVVPPGSNGAYRVPVLPFGQLSRLFLGTMPRALDILRSTLGVSAPLAVSAAMVGMRDVHFTTAAQYSHGPPIGRDPILTPWVAIEPGVDPATALSMVAEAVCQSGGYEKMPAVLDRR